MKKKTENKVEADSLTNSPVQQAETINNYYVSQPAIEAKPFLPGKLNNLPQRNINFTGREEILDGIHKSFESGNYAALTQAVTGLGGVGKSQTAIEYAYRYSGDYDVIWWINAESFDTLFLGFMEFAYESGLVDRDVIDHSIIVGSIKNWMAQNGRWLFILDNAEKPDDLKEYLPGMSKGNILITSRYAGWRNYREIDIDVFKPEEAEDFLIKSTKIEDREGAADLAEELGYLPLALEQAAAYILNCSISYAGYLKLYKKYRLEMFKGETSQPKDYNSTIAVTWNISIEKIKSESAKQLLNICSFFSGDSIDKSIFPWCTDCLPEPLAGDVKDDLKYNEIIYELSSYSLIKNQGSYFTMHRLLQEVIRDSLEKKEWLEICLNITHEKFKYDEYNTESWRGFSLLLRHALSIAGFAEKEDFGLGEAGRIYNESGIWQIHKAAYSEALILLQKEQKIYEELFGNEHPSMVIAYNNMASIYEGQGDYEKALGWYEKALEIKEKTLDKEHPSTATIYNNIAGVYDDQGDYKKALDWYQKAIEINEKVFGKEHPNTASDYNNIARVYHNQGYFEEALEWYGKAFEIYEKVLGKEHPNTAAIYDNIAGVYKDQGEYEKALEWYGKALKIKERVLGKEHPDTATTYNNIAGVYYSQGNYEKALEWFWKALEIKERVLGKEHPDTAPTYNNIAGVYKEQGDHEKALEWYGKALKIYAKVLGKEHPNIATTYNNIAGIYYRQGNYEKTLEFLLKAYKIYFKRQMTGYPNAKIIEDTIITFYIETGGKPEDFIKMLLEKLAEED